MRSNNLGEFDLLPNDPAVAYLLAKVTRSGRPSIRSHMIEDSSAQWNDGAFQQTQSPDQKSASVTGRRHIQ